MTRQWTEEQVATLRRMIETQGRSYEEAALELKIPRNTCIAKVRAEGMKSTWKAKGPAYIKKRSALSDVVFHHLPKPPKPLPPEPKHDGSLVALVDLGDRYCRWPVGDPRSPAFGFCGEPIRDGKSFLVDHESYCARHKAKSVVRMPA